MLDNAAAEIRRTAAMHVRFSAAGLDNLTARNYDADISAVPPSATGDATLLIDNTPTHTGFAVTGGKLTVTTEDGGTQDMGPAAGTFNPPALLNQRHGVADLITDLHDMRQTDSSGIDAHPNLVRLEGQLPADAATVLLPKQVIGDAVELPVAVWLDPAQRWQLAQLITRVGGGSATLQITSYGNAAPTPLPGAASSTVHEPPPLR